MITFLSRVFFALTAVPLGVEFESRSWPGGKDTSIGITVVAADGSLNDGATLQLQGTNDTDDVQVGLLALLELQGWDVRLGPDKTVLVFAPKGQWVRSVVVTSDGWRPGYRYVLGPLPKAKP